MDTVMLETAKWHTSQISVSFDRHPNIRRRAYDFEEMLTEHFGPANVLGIPENADPDMPRIVFAGKEERFQFVISETAMILFVGFPYAEQITEENVERDVAGKIDIPFNLLGRINVLPRITGLTTTVRFPMPGGQSAFMRHIARLIVSTQPERGYHDLNVKRTTVEYKKFFCNITIANYRTFNLAEQRPGVVRFPSRDVTQQGIEITGDYNDRYKYNEDKAYQSSLLTAQEIVRNGMKSMKDAIDELREVAR